MKRLGFVVILLVVVVCFIAGYWPQHKKWVQAQAETAAVSAKLSKAESTVRLCRLQGQLVTLIQETENKDFADASSLSTEFFNGVRSEVNATPSSTLKSSLDSVLNQRDAVTAAIARGDPKAHDLLVQLVADLSPSIANMDSRTPAKN